MALTAGPLTVSPSPPIPGAEATWSVTWTAHTGPAANTRFRCALWNGVGTAPANDAAYLALATKDESAVLATGATTFTCSIKTTYTAATSPLTARLRLFTQGGTASFRPEVSASFQVSVGILKSGSETRRVQIHLLPPLCRAPAAPQNTHTANRRVTAASHCASHRWYRTLRS